MQLPITIKLHSRLGDIRHSFQTQNTDYYHQSNAIFIHMACPDLRRDVHPNRGFPMHLFLSKPIVFLPPAILIGSSNFEPIPLNDNLNKTVPYLYHSKTARNHLFIDCIISCLKTITKR